jgi:hypothetical protein
MSDQQKNRGFERFRNLATIRFSEAGPRDLVVSIKNNRIVLGQRIYFKLDHPVGAQDFIYANNAPSLSSEDARKLIEALQKGIDEIEMRAARSGREDEY